MSRDIAAFLLVTAISGALAGLGLALQAESYAFGEIGVARLDALASSATFIPLASLYALAAALTMILPIRAAGYVHAQAAVPIYFVGIVLLATIAGLQAARFAFGDRNALWSLIDWQFIFAAAIIVAHVLLDTLRRNALTRSLALVAFLAATLACLFWTFRL